MSAFYDLIDELTGDADDLADIVVSVRKCWLYDFRDDPVRLWAGKGTLIDASGNEWLGTMDASGRDHHQTPPLQDARDGSSPTYNFSLVIPDLPGENKGRLHEELKAEQAKVYGRSLTCYLAAFREGEALRPGTPLSFYREMTMFSPKFSETIQRDGDGKVVKSYRVSIVAKDGNSGRSETPGRTYADTMQKRRAAELGVSVDRGAEYLALLANRTYQIP